MARTKWTYTDQEGFHRIFIWLKRDPNRVELSHHSSFDKWELTPQEAEFIRDRISSILRGWEYTDNKQ